MGRTYESIDDDLKRWIDQQPVFFVGSAPNGPDGHVNVSPKGAKDTFRIIGPRRVAYLDLIGSGIETTAHLRENGRIVVMFCAFSGPPKVVRLHGQGRVIPEGDPEFESAVAEFHAPAELAGLVRSVIQIEVSRISDSCGFVVPEMQLVEERQQLMKWSQNQEKRWGSDWKAGYVQSNNLASIDGLPALAPATSIDLDDEALAGRSSAGRAL